MRISDWSSDVCSSDLEVRLASSHAVVAIAVPIAPQSVRRKLISPAADVWCCAGTELSASAVSPTKKKGMQIGRAHVELQSLMRISYAVFCLKKKTRHN